MRDVPKDRLTIDEASSLRDYMFLRRLRNQVRNRMTNDTEPVSHIRQIRFFLSMRRRSKATAAIRIFIAKRGGEPVGYLLTKSVEDVVYVTEAVERSCRRQGIGKRLLNFAKCRHPELVAEIRDDNGPSIALHRSMGFVLEHLQDGLAVYRFRKSV